MFDKYETEHRLKKLMVQILRTMEFSDANTNEDMIMIFNFKDKWAVCDQYQTDGDVEKSIYVRIGDTGDPWDE